MAEHTPTPWFHDGSYVTDRGDGIIGRSIADCAKSPNIDRAVQQVNAAFIVKAVNSHEALIEALEKIEYASRKDSLTDAERLQSVRTMACAILSRVGGARD